MRTSILRKILKCTLWLLAIIAGIVVLALIAIYLPPVQDFAVGKVLESINRNDSLHVSVDRFRLSPPLNIEANGVTITQLGDTMVHVDNAELSVALLPLLKGNLGIDEIVVSGATYNMGNPDSVMCLQAEIGNARLADAEINPFSKTVDLDLLTIDRSLVSLDLKTDTTAATPKDSTSTPLPWQLNINQFKIDSLAYRMSMQQSIDSLGVTIGAALIDNTSVNLSQQKVDVKEFVVEKMTAAYLTPAQSDTVPASPGTADDTTESSSEPWSVNVAKISIKADNALYGVAGAIPTPGLDMSHIEVTRVNIAVDSLYNRGAELRVPIKEISASERCGLDLKLSGLFAMNSDSLYAHGISLTTPRSALNLNAMMGLKSDGLPMPLTVKGSGQLSPADASAAFPAMMPFAAGVPAQSALDINIDINGQNGLYAINDLSLELPRCFNLAAKGTMTATTDMDYLDGQINITGDIAGGNWTKPALAAAKLDKSVRIPHLAVKGKVNMKQGRATGSIAAVTDSGRIALDASWIARPEKYDIALTAKSFPVNAIMPLLEVERVSADVAVKGKGYDPFKKSTTLDASVKVNNITYKARRYSDIDMTASIADGNADITATSGNSAARFDVRASGNLSATPYDWTIDADIARLDLKEIGLTDSAMNGTVNLNGRASVIPGKKGSINADMNIENLDWHMSGTNLATTDMKLHFSTTDSLTALSLNNHDLAANISAPHSLDSLMAYPDRITAAVDSAMAHNRIEVRQLQQALPQFTADVSAGQNNIVHNYLNGKNMGFTALYARISNDSLINMDARVMNFNSGTTVIDTITAGINQQDEALKYRFHIGNRPGTLDQWAQVTAQGRATDNRLSILLNQQNIDGKTGYRLGFIARLMPDGVKVRIVPAHPVIGYKNWTVNDSNFIAVNTVMKHFDADLSMSSSESSIHLFTDHANRRDSLQEDLILNIKDMKLAEWIALNPFAPPVAGDLSADMRFGWNDNAINGDGTISLTDLKYNKQRVGSFDLGVGLQTNKSGTVRAQATLMVDSIKTITAEGNLNDSTARNPFLLDFKMIHFPLNVLNPFLPKDMARFTGTLNGTMDITGSLAEPVFNGYLDFDSTALAIPMFGTTYRFSDEKIPMDSNVVSFNNFTIMGANDSPLSINGTVDARHISDILIDLNADANNMQIVKSSKKRGVQVYGKAFIDLNAKVKGSMSRLDVNANLSVLDNTNVTYIMESATDNLTSRSGSKMVKFVNFADTTLVADVDSVAPTSMAMSINAILNVRQGSTIGIDLSTDGKNRVQLLSQGSLNYNMNYMGDSRLTGRLNINGGFVRYTPPFMSEKLFDFSEGSYVSFNGDMMTPYLNIKAVDVLRANVQQEGQNSRLINFDVLLSVTNSLDNMNVAFDLSTNDDITVANELQSMTPEQRANQAMNLLLYNVYTGPGTRASSSLNGNPLFSFLESKVNSWAANNIKGVDLSFGIDQYDKTVNGASSTTTSYSYKMSKSLFNDRFKISIGGNYASDADADQNVTQNLINDISVEYNITSSGSMYIKIFRHTGYESILEGEVTQTGVGFVYKRKLRRLSDLFKPFYRRPKTVATPAPAQK